MNDAASDDSDSGGESPAEGIIDKGPVSPESDSTDNESRSPWECDGTTRKWKDLKRLYKAEGKDEPPLLNGVETISMCLLYRNPGIKDFYEAMGMMGLSGMEQPKGIVPDTVKCPPLYPPIWANEDYGRDHRLP